MHNSNLYIIVAVAVVALHYKHHVSVRLWCKAHKQFEILDWLDNDAYRESLHSFASILLVYLFLYKLELRSPNCK